MEVKREKMGVHHQPPEETVPKLIGKVDMDGCTELGADHEEAQKLLKHIYAFADRANSTAMQIILEPNEQAFDGPSFDMPAFSEDFKGDPLSVAVRLHIGDGKKDDWVTLEVSIVDLVREAIGEGSVEGNELERIRDGLTRLSDEISAELRRPTGEPI